MDVLVRYLHFASILVLFGTLLAENILIKRSLPRSELKRLARIDAAFGLSAASALTAGLLLWFKSHPAAGGADGPRLRIGMKREGPGRYGSG